MRFINISSKDIGFYNEDGFEPFLKRQDIKYDRKVKDGCYFYEYYKNNGQRVLVCVKCVVEVDSMTEYRYLFELDKNETYELEQVLKIIDEL